MAKHCNYNINKSAIGLKKSVLSPAYIQYVYLRSPISQVGSKVSVLLDSLAAETKNECVRVGSWGVLGKATGANLVYNGTSDPVKLNDLIGVDMAILRPELVTHDPVTGLLRPQAGTAMRLADGTVTPVPDEWFLHPQTGKVLPIEGHVNFDPISSRLIFTADSASGKLSFCSVSLLCE